MEMKNRNAGYRSPQMILLAGFLSIAISLIFAAPWIDTTAAAQSGPIVVTENGAVQGLVAENENQFLGIPFATPPLRQFRWRPAQPPKNWSGVLPAVQFGNFCPQFDSLIGQTIGAEDCLFLNVYSPLVSPSAGAGLPVMVWIHGGGLIGGDASEYDPTPLVQQGVIVVTINYRLGLLGFFAQTALDKNTRVKGNYGFTDQQLALKWVKRNIAAFGGNPHNVTIFGESAGGQSIYANLASPTARRLFARAIAESGSYGD